MRIACPSCQAEYEVPDVMLAAGPRHLRCARCGHGFVGALPATAPAAPPGPEPPIPGPPSAGPNAAVMPEQGEPSTTTPPSTPQANGPAAAESLAQEPPDRASLPADGVPAPERPKPISAPVAGPDRPPPTRGLAHHSPIDAPEDEPPPPAPGRLVAAWLGSLALLGAGVTAVLVFRAEIAAAWPPAARFYAALGLG